MTLATFDFCEKTKTINILGNIYDEKVIDLFLKLITQVSKKYEYKSIKIIGNFDSKLLFQNLFLNKSKKDIDKILLMFQLISKTMESSKVTFLSEISGIIQGPAMEIALSCNFVKAKENSFLKLDETSHGIIPFLGTTFRLSRLIGYKNALQAFLIDKKLSYEQAVKFKLFNDGIDNYVKIKKTSIFWDQLFTNTFIFYNSKIHSIYKNKNPAYNAILSIIYETSICNYETGLSIEKRWLKWLMTHKLFKYETNV